MKNRIAFTLILAVFLAGCAPNTPARGESTPFVITAEVSTAVAEPIDPNATAVPFPTPEPPTVIPTWPAASLSPTQLKYRILDEFPDFFFCDPDFYPIACEGEIVLALQRFPLQQANHDPYPICQLLIGRFLWASINRIMPHSMGSSIHSICKGIRAQTYFID